MIVRPNGRREPIRIGGRMSNSPGGRRPARTQPLGPARPHPPGRRAPPSAVRSRRSARAVGGGRAGDGDRDRPERSGPRRCAAPRWPAGDNGRAAACSDRPRARPGSARSSQAVLAAHRDRLRRPAVAVEEPRRGGGGVHSAERGNVGGLGPVEDVAGGEHARARGVERGVHGRPPGAGVKHRPGRVGELVVGDPVRGKDDQVALDRPGGARLEVGELDRLDSPAAADRGERGAGQERRAEAKGRPQAEPLRAIDGGGARWSSRGSRAAVGERDQS